MTDKDRILSLCVKSLETKGLSGDLYKDRLKEEIKEIDTQNEYAYLLSLYDKQARFKVNENNSLVSYLLDLCPAPNIQQPPMYIYGEFPDLDIDYIKEVRDYLKAEWAPKTFGKDNVCNIGSYHTFKLSSAIIDMVRIHGYDRQEILNITTKLPEKDEDGKPITFDKAIELSKELAAYFAAHPDVADASRRLVHRNRGRGTHAGGLIIAKDRVDRLVPLIIDEEGKPVSAWVEGQASQDLAPVGLLKFDLLVVSNLVQIAKCCELIKQRRGIQHICSLPNRPNWTDDSYLEDPKALALANEGRLRCIFQFDSPGIRQLAKTGGVDRFEDLVVYSSIFRPGPLSQGMDKIYCKRKKGLEKYEIHPLLKPVLAKTYGVMCVHEDTKIARTDGLEVPIKEMKRLDPVFSLNLDTLKIESDVCHGAGPTRFEDGYKLTLSNGYSVILTHDHPVYTFDGYKHVENLDLSKDLIACPRKLTQDIFNSDFEDQTSWLGDPVKIAYLIGQIIGDASTKFSVDLCSGTEANTLKLKDWVEQNIPKITINQYFHCRSWYLRFSCAELLNDPNHGNRKTRFGKMIDNLNLRSTCYNKRIPKQIFLATKDIQLSCLAGLIDSDGFIGEFCTIASVNKMLLEDVRHLLALQGVESVLVKHRIIIYNTKKLHDLLNQYLVLKSFENELHFGDTIGTVPSNAINELWEKSGTPQREFAKLHNVSTSSLRKNKLHNSRTYTKCGGDLGDVYFYKIKSIEIIKDQQFYAMSVAKNHNFIGNGIVLKNCYQEQIIKVLHLVGDIPLKDCEMIRKAISKKKDAIFAKYKEMFLENGQRNLSATLEEVQKLWEQIEAFAGYGFNKSHSAAYSMISSRLLYLKAHYPLEFFAAILSCENDVDKIKEYKGEAESFGVKVNQINLNKSNVNFSIVDDEIYMGFSNIKGLGEDVAQQIVNHQPYEGLLDFLFKFGTNESVIKRFIGLKIFGEDSVHLYELYAAYKNQQKKLVNRDKRFEKAKAVYLEQLEFFTKDNAQEIFDKAVATNDHTCWRSFITLEEEDPELPNEIDKLVKKYMRCLQNYSKKEQTDVLALLKEFKPTGEIDPELKKIYDADPVEAEFLYYGFGWNHILERSPDFNPERTFNIFNDDTITCTSVDVHIISPPVAKQSKNGNTYYTVEVEDANFKSQKITFWEDDWNIFQEELTQWYGDERSKRGNLVKMRVKKPEESYFNYTFDSPPKRFRWKEVPKNKADDARLIVMRRPEQVEHVFEMPEADRRMLYGNQ